MKIASIGGGPAGLYFSILMKKAFPDFEIDEVDGSVVGMGIFPTNVMRQKMMPCPLERQRPFRNVFPVTFRILG